MGARISLVPNDSHQLGFMGNEGKIREPINLDSSYIDFFEFDFFEECGITGIGLELSSSYLIGLFHD